jgi:SAM-dependent methyltransferase
MNEKLHAKERMEVLARCDLCNSEGPFYVLAASEFAESPHCSLRGFQERQRTVICKYCGWIFKPVVLSPRDVLRLYNAVGGAYTYREQDYPRVAEKAERIFRLMQSYCGSFSSDLAVLDVGGGMGQASLAFARSGCDVDVLDVSTGPMLHWRMRSQTGRIEELELASQYSVILVSHVLEHLWTPKEVLEKARELLLPGGAVYVEVPFELFTPLLLRKTGDPAHVGYFGRRTLRAFLDCAGFVDLSVKISLETYGQRNVVVIRGLGRKPETQRSRKAGSKPPRLGWLHLAGDLFSLTQLSLTLISRLT